MTGPGRFERRYTWRGSRAHLLALYVDPFTTLCGLEVFRICDWYGTGTQDEYEKAAALPLCQHCANAVGQ